MLFRISTEYKIAYVLSYFETVKYIPKTMMPMIIELFCESSYKTSLKIVRYLIEKKYLAICSIDGCQYYKITKEGSSIINKQIIYKKDRELRDAMTGGVKTSLTLVGVKNIHNKKIDEELYSNKAIFRVADKRTKEYKKYETKKDRCSRSDEYNAERSYENKRNKNTYCVAGTEEYNQIIKGKIYNDEKITIDNFLSLNRQAVAEILNENQVFFSMSDIIEFFNEFNVADRIQGSRLCGILITKNKFIFTYNPAKRLMKYNKETEDGIKKLITEKIKLNIKTGISTSMKSYDIYFCINSYMIDKMVTGLGQIKSRYIYTGRNKSGVANINNIGVANTELERKENKKRIEINYKKEGEVDELTGDPFDVYNSNEKIRYKISGQDTERIIVNDREIKKSNLTSRKNLTAQLFTEDSVAVFIMTGNNMMILYSFINDEEEQEEKIRSKLKNIFGDGYDDDLTIYMPTLNPVILREIYMEGMMNRNEKKNIHKNKKSIITNKIYIKRIMELCSVNINFIYSIEDIVSFEKNNKKD